MLKKNSRNLIEIFIGIYNLIWHLCLCPCLYQILMASQLIKGSIHWGVTACQINICQMIFKLFLGLKNGKPVLGSVAVKI